jgi:hypothetical protein
MLERLRAWSGALTVTLVATALVVLDLSDGPVRRYWSRHTFTSSILSGFLVLLLTVLIVDRVTRMRQLRNQSRVISVQALVIVAQGARTADAIARSSSSTEDREEASGELRTYTQMLLTSAPVLIEGRASRAFLETAQRVAGQFFQTLSNVGEQGVEDRKPGVEDAVAQLRDAAAPLLAVLPREWREAVSPDQAGSP